jgi:undecaprenyl diphosphate synthase
LFDWCIDVINQVTEELISHHLSTAAVVAEVGEPDLLIRTSGEQRISNYMLWELAYTELCFLDVPWPDFGEKQFAEALAEFATRQRRFGRRQ